MNGRPGSKNFAYSPALQEFTKATNIRLRFLRTNTLLGHLISKAQRDPTVTRRVRVPLYTYHVVCKIAHTDAEKFHELNGNVSFSLAEK